jgi:hypothetical protein
MTSVLGWVFTPALASAPVHPPQFTEYPVSTRYTGPRALPLLQRGTAAWRYRSQIRRIAAGKPNFAGHYRIGTWGCGSECLHFAIVDAKTGMVYFNQLLECDWTFGLTTREIATPIAFKRSSRLLVLDGSVSGDGRFRPHYFKFEHGHLVALH